jgi:hypothetical protein
LGKFGILENYYMLDTGDLSDNARKVVWLKNTLIYFSFNLKIIYFKAPIFEIVK